MLGNAQVAALLPTTDIEAAKDFYQNKLGLKLLPIENGPVVFEAGDGTTLEVYPRSEPSKAEHSVAAFRVTDIASVIAELEGKGVVFEDYEGTVNHVMEYGPTKLAWLKDPDGNILSLSEDPRFG
jgi:catechol 2,3-dioxygenase-like lactoylglutathione lyase family enzyme